MVGKALYFAVFGSCLSCGVVQLEDAADTLKKVEATFAPPRIVHSVYVKLAMAWVARDLPDKAAAVLDALKSSPNAKRGKDLTAVSVNELTEQHKSDLLSRAVAAKSVAASADPPPIDTGVDVAEMSVAVEDTYRSVMSSFAVQVRAWFRTCAFRPLFGVVQGKVSEAQQTLESIKAIRKSREERGSATPTAVQRVRGRASSVGSEGLPDAGPPRLVSEIKSDSPALVIPPESSGVPTAVAPTPASDGEAYAVLLQSYLSSGRLLEAEQVVQVGIACAQPCHRTSPVRRFPRTALRKALLLPRMRWCLCLMA
jgi:hypothetical protein